jgi:hypothetical protein
MSRFVTVRVCDNSGKDLLGVAHLVEIDNDSTFHDVLADLPSEVTDRELIEIKLREFESSPDSESLTLRQGLLSKTLELLYTGPIRHDAPLATGCLIEGPGQWVW